MTTKRWNGANRRMRNTDWVERLVSTQFLVGRDGWSDGQTRGYCIQRVAGLRGGFHRGQDEKTKGRAETAFHGRKADSSCRSPSRRFSSAPPNNTGAGNCLWLPKITSRRRWSP